MYDSSTRGMLLHMLKTKGPLAIAEMARQLGVTEMAIRRHMHAFERDGLVQKTLSRQAMGRPTHRYALTEKAEACFPTNYHHLTLDLLGELALEEGEQRISELFRLRKLKLHGKYAQRMEGMTFAGRVQELAQIQDENGYMVLLEQEEDGRYVLMEHHCPIFQVARQFGDACTCELALFRELLGAEVERTECLAKGGAKCSYVIQPSEARG